MNKKVKNKSFSHYSFFPKNRKGTHVEVVISFIIFIVFVVFIFAASKPVITKQQDKSNLLDSLEYNLIEEFSSDVKVITFAFSSGGNCITLDNSISDLGIGNRIVVKNSSGKILESSRVGINGDSITISGVSPQETLFNIYYSQEFSPITTGSLCASAGEDIGLTKTDKYVFQQKIQTAINTGNYNDLKEEMDVPENMDFTFGIVLSNGTLIERSHPELESDISTSIYVKDVPIEYIGLNGDINTGYLKIKIW